MSTKLGAIHRSDADSALASRANALEANIGDVEVSLTDEQQARATGDEALANDIACLSSRLDSEGANWRAELEALRKDIQDEIMRLDGRIDSMVDSKAQARGSEHSMLGEVIGELWIRLGETPPGQADD